jgi:hypothetical protein
MMRRFLAIACLALSSASFAATPVTLPVAKDAAGNYVLATPIIPLNTDNSVIVGAGGGTVQIDQTTPGTTNGVVVNSGAVTATGNVASGATDSGNPVKIGAKYNATLPTYTDGQRAELAVNAKGSLITVQTSGVAGADAQGNGTLAAPIVSSGSTATMMGVGNYLFNGTSWDRVRGDTTSGTYVGGAVASGAADSGNPVKVGGKYNATVLPTFSDGQRTDFQTTIRGLLRVYLHGTAATPADAQSNGLSAGINGEGDLGNTRALTIYPFVFNGSTWDRARGDVNGTAVQSAPSANFWNYAAASGGITNTTTAVTIKAAAGAGVRNYLKTLQLYADALGTATEIAIRDGAAGTVLWRGKIGTGGLTAGQAITFDPPLKGTANTLMEFVTLTATTTGAVYVNAQGYTGS